MSDIHDTVSDHDTGKGDTPAISADPPRERKRFRPWRALFWLVLLGASIALWIVVHQRPDLQEKISAMIGTRILPREGTAVVGTDEQFDAEQAARMELTNRGALVIAEPGSRAVSSVSFPKKEIDDEALQLLKPLFRLTSLNLGGTNISDEQLKDVGSLRSLVSLVLSNAAVTDEGLAHLRGLRKLEVIHLCNTKITDAGLAHLTGFSEMKIIDVSKTGISDEGLEHLSGLHKLSWLLIRDVPVTDAGLEHLHGMKNLKELTLPGTRVTADGISSLCEAVPGLKVDQ